MKHEDLSVHVRYEVHIAVKMLILRIVSPCGLVGAYQRFGGKKLLHLQDAWD
jgi:hypothetical protein